MFLRKNNAHQRKAFTLTGNQILEDIKAVSHSEEQRTKLYLCIEEKPPQEHKYAKIGDFLKGTEDLENLSEKMEDITDELSLLKKDVEEKVYELKEKVRLILSEDKQSSERCSNTYVTKDV